MASLIFIGKVQFSRAKLESQTCQPIKGRYGKELMPSLIISNTNIFFILLLGVKYFGLTSSGSQRWLNFYFMNLQPSELMKIGLILFLAKYYHRISTQDVNRIKFLFLPIVALVAPVLLVVAQPDLGTSILIALGGITVSWLAGVRVKFFAYASILFIFNDWLIFDQNSNRC